MMWSVTSRATTTTLTTTPPTTTTTITRTAKATTTTTMKIPSMTPTTPKLQTTRTTTTVWDESAAQRDDDRSNPGRQRAQKTNEYTGPTKNRTTTKSPTIPTTGASWSFFRTFWSTSTPGSRNPSRTFSYTTGTVCRLFFRSRVWWQSGSLCGIRDSGGGTESISPVERCWRNWQNIRLWRELCAPTISRLPDNEIISLKWFFWKNVRMCKTNLSQF